MLLLLLPGLAAAAGVPVAAALRALAVLTLWYSKMVLRQPAGGQGQAQHIGFTRHSRPTSNIARASAKQAMLA